jgi:hypothetical protein
MGTSGILQLERVMSDNVESAPDNFLCHEMLTAGYLCSFRSARQYSGCMIAEAPDF